LFSRYPAVAKLMRVCAAVSLQAPWNYQEDEVRCCRISTNGWIKHYRNGFRFVKPQHEESVIKGYSR